jgi:hypothetical protein
VTWQEELRRLDEELASGQLNADDYRARRDQVLSSAVTPGASPAPQPQTSQASGSQANDTQIIQPVSPPQGVPQQQPQQSHQQPQQQAPQQQPSPEATQIVSSAETGGERTQVVSSWQTQQPQQDYRQPNTGQPSPPSGFQPPHQQAWNAPQEDVSPPWGSSEFPPIAPPRSSDWVAQGPETFSSSQSSGKGKKVALSLVALLVIAGLGVGVWLLFIRDTGPDTPIAAPTSVQPVPSPTLKPLPEPPVAKPETADDASTLVDPPGAARNGGGEFDMEKLKTSKLLPAPMITALEQGGMTSGLLKPSTDNGTTVGIYSLSLPDPQAATTAAQAYGTAQRTGGLPPNRELSLLGVPVYATSNGDGVYRAVYVVYNRVVIVEAFGSDRPNAQATFQELLTSQVDKAPPTVRTGN